MTAFSLQEILAHELGNFSQVRFWVGMLVDLAGLFILYRAFPHHKPGPAGWAALAGCLVLACLTRAYELVILPHALFGYCALSAVFEVRSRRNRLYLALVYAVLCRIGRSLLMGLLFFASRSNLAVFALGAVVRLALFFLFSRYMGRVASTRKTAPDWLLLAACAAQVVFVHLMVPNLAAISVSSFVESVIYLGALCALWAALWRIDSEDRARELDEVKRAVDQRYTLFEQRTEASREMARLYHDLKFQMTGLAALGDSDRLQSSIRQLSRGIEDYESLYHTGNEVLDAVLSEKARQARDKGITLSVVADLSRLSFVSPVDICSTMGNALANAIEATEKVADADKRVIKVSSADVGGYLAVKVSNHYSGQVRAHGDGLATTKAEPGHGIGMASIRYSLSHYEGRLQYKAEGGVFELTMLFKRPVVSD